MATSYLNVGVLGQALGGTLSIGGLKSSFESLKAGVQRKKRTISGVSEAEREAQRKRREERLAASQETTGVRVDTSDIAPQALPGAASKPAGVVTAPAVQAPALAPSTQTLAPEKQFTDADRAFASAFGSYNTLLMGKNASSVRSGRGELQASLTDVLTTAKATGREDVIKAVGGITGILGNKDISARNVGQAKATTGTASSAIRSVLDIDTLLRENLKAAPTSPVAPAATAMQTLRTGRRRFAGFGL